MSLADYEKAEGEAVVRYMVKNIPPIDPDVPKVYTVVKGEKLLSTSMDFIRRLEDLKLTFVSGEVLTVREPERSIVDPRSGLSPVTIQVMNFKQIGTEKWEVQVGWAYKKTFERRKLVLEKSGDSYQVSSDEREEGNYLPVQPPTS